MRGIWITTGLVLSLVIPWNCAKPFQQRSTTAAGEDDDDDVDSDEQEFNRIQQNILDRLSIRNVTDQELALKASAFLAQYFNQVGTEKPLQLPNSSNQTIIITIVPNSNGTGNATGPGAMTIAIPVSENQVPPRAVPENIPPQPPTTTQGPRRIRPSPPNQGVDNIEDAILEALSFAQGQVPSNVAGPGASIQYKLQNNHNNNNNNIFQSSGFNNLAANPPAPATTPKPTDDGSNFPLSAPFPLSPLSPQNNGVVYVQVQQQQQQPQQPVLQAPPPTPPAPAPAPQDVDQNTLSPFIFVALPPQAASTERQRPRPAGPNPLYLGLNLFGSLAEGDLGEALENTFKLAEAPVVQDTARLAAVGLLHNVFQGFNCNVLGNCNRAPLKIIVP